VPFPAFRIAGFPVIDFIRRKKGIGVFAYRVYLFLSRKKKYIASAHNKGEVMNKLLFVLMFAGLIATGCAHRNAVQNGPQAGQEGPSAVEQSRVEKKSAAQQTAPANLSSGEIEKNAVAEKAAEKKISDIHFSFDKYNLEADAKPVLKEVADLLLKDGRMKVVIEGNCDDRGTEEYNLALGDGRAQEAKTYLVALGVPAVRIQTASYGKEKPLCHEDNEKCWARNRRDHFAFSEGTN
jgi:peptidoglycan-associated lipoprotein